MRIKGLAGSKRPANLWLWAAALGVALLLLPQAAYAQLAGTVTGTVYDTTSAVIPGAEVTLTNDANGDTRKTVSNDVGRFAFASVVPGTYTARVSAPGFKGWEQKAVSVSPGDVRNLASIVLEVGELKDQITIQETPGVVPVDSGERSTTLTSKDIGNLSLVGRDVTELLRILPGMAVFNGGSVANQPGYNGLTLGFTNAVGNGYVPNGLPFRGGTDLTSDSAHIIDPGCNCSSTQAVNADMTSEVKVQTSNFGADSAKGPVVVNAVGKSGTSSYHGEGYLYARDSSMNSADWYMNRMSLAKPPDRYMYPGGNIGGPVPHTNKKMFFWGGYEYYYQKLPPQTPLTSYVPTNSMRQGDFGATAPDNAAFCGTSGAPWVMCPLAGGSSALTGTLPGGADIASNGKIPQNLFDAGGLALLKIIPTPNVDPRTTPGGVNYVLPYTTTQNGWMVHSRVDYNFTDNSKLYVSYNLQRQKDDVPVHLWWQPANSVPFPGGMSSQDNSNTISGHYVHIFGPTLTNEVVATFAYINFPLKPNDPSLVSRSKLGYPFKGIYGNGDPMIPSLSNGYWTPQPMMDQPDLFYPGGTFVWKKFAPTFEDNLSKVYRSHTLKFGFYWERTANNQGSFAYTNGEAAFYPWGSYSNNTALNMLLGRPTEFWENNFQAITNMSYRSYSAYAMDNWKVARRLTLVLGARFEHLTGWNDDDQKTGFAVWTPSQFATQAAQGVELPGLTWRARNPGVPFTGVPNRFAFVSPRFGLSYDLFGNGRTVLRGGWGLYRWHDSYNEYAGALQSAQGSRQFHDYSGSTFGGLDTLLAGAASAGGLASGAFGLNPLDDQWPLTYQYNFTVSQRMPWNSLLEVAYVGNNTVNQLFEGSGSNFRLDNVNTIPVGGLFKADPITGAASDPLSANLANYSPFGTQCLARDAKTGVCTTTAPGFGSNQVAITQHGGYSNYNALQVSWARQKGKATINLNYSFSKALGIRGTGQLGGSSSDGTNIANNYGVLSHDRTNVFNASYHFDLGTLFNGKSALLKGVANGWTVAGISTLQSGPDLQSLYNPNFSIAVQPLDPSDPSHTKLLSEYGDANLSKLALGTPDVRVNPIYTCNPTQGLKANQYINPSCFAVPSYQWVNGHLQVANGPAMPSYYIRGPAFFNSDLSAYKTFKFADKHSVQFRFSAFNFLNHPLLSMDPNNTTTMDLHFKETSPGHFVQTNQNFGYAPIKLGRRVIELGIKYQF